MNRPLVASAAWAGLLAAGCANLAARSDMPEPYRPVSTAPAVDAREGYPAIAEAINSGVRPVPATDKPPALPAEEPAPVAGSMPIAPPISEPAPALDPVAEPMPIAPPESEPEPAPADAMPLPADAMPLPGPSPSPEPTPVDPTVKPAGLESSALAIPARANADGRSPVDFESLPQAEMAMARVGEEVISLRELKAAVDEQLQKVGQPIQSIPKAEINRAAAAVLDSLIERSMIVQEAKRTFKNPKQLAMVYEFSDKDFLETEVPPLLRRYKAADEYELRQKLVEEGRSFDELRDEHRVSTLAKEYLRMQVAPRLGVSLPEMRTYYNKHIDAFNRPAKVSWREIAVDFNGFPDRAAARAKADALLARLRKGEDFAALARAESRGPTASEGGLWETSPDSYAVPAVNQALDTLPQKQVSPILEGPTAYHIVRVDARRPAGPARFDEVQDEIRDSIYREKVRRESDAYIAKLRARTLVRSELDPSAGAPKNAGDR